MFQFFELFRDSVFRSDGSVSPIGLVATLVTLAGIGIFMRMARDSLNNRRDSPEARRLERERDQRAEAIAESARRELAEAKRKGDGS